ncbi:MAG: glycosyltransferase [Proteobacteria bacterium TMED72]|nr:MAG: glycosyltransferase [Proteobacteria bacterium TMED72]RPG20898.1 MAG: glycosyltransferase [Phycisphaera sp. TMED9]
MSTRVLMLGWEFPPFITGGLGTACHGLTRAMDRAGMETTFVLPKSVPGDAEDAVHVELVSPASDMGETLPEYQHQTVATTETVTRTVTKQPERRMVEVVRELRERFKHTRFVDLPVEVQSVYREQETTWQRVIEEYELDESRLETLIQAGAFGDPVTMTESMALRSAIPERDPEEAGLAARESKSADYGGDLIGQAHAYAKFCLEVAKRTQFDVVHAHDWLTYPAGLAVAQLTGKPLVVHVHSTEFDRSGEHVNQAVYNIERRGMHGAMQVIAVSQLTKNLCVARYGIPPSKVDVVYNGVEFDPASKGVRPINPKDKIVLFFGRITMQKGPEYFVQAAKRVLDVMEDVKFVVAGSGDLASMMIEMAAEMGIGHKVLFTGFLRGGDIKLVFSLADLYVMPSVSEPFGIAPLEAMSHDVPALISKSSGVSEVLTHALKVDFWDVEEMANKIVAVLRHPPLRKALRDNGQFEIRALTWDGAATRCGQVYDQVLRQFAAKA